ncbi:MAG: hypothetical protein DMF85_02510, partial [Acidobacteria bacterium]
MEFLILIAIAALVIPFIVPLIALTYAWRTRRRLMDRLTDLEAIVARQRDAIADLSARVQRPWRDTPAAVAPQPPAVPPPAPAPAVARETSGPAPA